MTERAPPVARYAKGFGDYRGYSPSRRTNFVNLSLGDWLDFNRVVAIIPYRPLWYRVWGMKNPHKDPRVLNLCHGHQCRTIILLDDGTLVRSVMTAPTLVIRSEGKVRPRATEGVEAEGDAES